MTWLLLGAQALISSAGLLMLRYAMPIIFGKGLSAPFASIAWGAFGMLLYGVSFLMWLFILSKNPVSFAYPITVGATLAFTVVGSYLLLDEKVTPLQIIGIVLMAVAVLFLSSGTHSGSNSPRL